jgi:hypothetical protein
MRVPSFSASTARRAATVAAVGFGIVASFQLLLALGAPWGQAALGGANEGTLPPELRVASSVSMALFPGAVFLVLGRAGLWGSDRFSGVCRVGAWALVVILPIGALLNLDSAAVRSQAPVVDTSGAGVSQAGGPVDNLQSTPGRPPDNY